MPKPQARAIVENEIAMIDYKIDKELVTKTDLKEQIQLVREDLIAEIQTSRSETKEIETSLRDEIQSLRNETQSIKMDIKDLDGKIKEVQIEILKAMNMQVWKFYLALGGLVLLLTLINKFL